MIDRKALWSPAGGLYAVAAGLVILAIVTGASILAHRYQFASSSLDGQVVWRGDTVTRQAVLCATDRYAAGMAADARGWGVITRC